MSIAFAEELHTALDTEVGPAADIRKSPDQLAEIARSFASSPGWIERVRLSTERRWYERLYRGPDHDIWAISWLPGQSTGFHDHGESAGAFTVVLGALQEHRPGEAPLTIGPGESRTFGSDYAHDVRNVSLAPAISIHVYSPPLSDMNHYELDGDGLRLRAGDSQNASDEERWKSAHQGGGSKPVTSRSIDQVLADARAQLQRLSPLEACEAVQARGAVLVDIRPEAQRKSEGTIPGALIVERNVLEWRFDPESDARLPIATSHDLEVIVFCSAGYTSSLAAAALQELGLWKATDVAGGFHAWQSFGLPSTPAQSG